MSMARSTAAIASLPQTSFCSGLATGASARTPCGRFSLAFMGALSMQECDRGDHTLTVRRGERTHRGEQRLDRFALEVPRDEHDARAAVLARPGFERDRRMEHVLRALHHHRPALAFDVDQAFDAQ